MSPYAYDYAPLSTDHKPRTSRKSWLWPAAFTTLFLTNLIVYWFHPQTPLTPLDNFQILNNVPVVNTSAGALLNPNEHAVVSSLYTDAYATAVSTLGHSLKSHNTTARMILMYLPDRVSNHTKCIVTAAGWTLHPVDLIPPPHDGKGIIDRFKDQYTKLNLWNLDSLGIKSLVYLDADTLVRQNFDEIFSLPYSFAAVPDVFEDNRGYTIAFNAGIMLLRPSTAVFNDMRAKLAIARYPPQFAEQAFLNLYFGAQAVRLPYMYNGNLAIKKRTPELWAAIVPDLRIVHYTLVKPFPMENRTMSEEEEDEYVQASKTAQNGIFSEILGWWEQEWRDMKAAQQTSLERCAW